MNFLKVNNQKGAAAILLALLILGVIILVALGLSAIFVGELKVSTLIRQSGPAFYAAEAGTEYALYQVSHLGVANGNSFQTLSNGATFSVEWNVNSIRSVGKYANTRRKVEVTW